MKLHQQKKSRLPFLLLLLAIILAYIWLPAALTIAPLAYLFRRESTSLTLVEGKIIWRHKGGQVTIDKGKFFVVEHLTLFSVQDWLCVRLDGKAVGICRLASLDQAISLRDRLNSYVIQ